MNKVISINIGGSIFQVEENAFEKLNSYLNELKKHFSNKPEGNEIITDIENRIAELLRAKLNAMKAAINLEDVNEVTDSMGAPKDFASEEDELNEKETSTSGEDKKQNFIDNEPKQNRVYRDPDGRIIGGVCSGLGHYFKIDPVWIRLFFVVVALTSLKLIFFGASPVLIYIILWIIIPEAKTTAEKLQMRKEKINIDNIQKSVQTEFGKVKDAVQSPKFQDQATNFFRTIFDLVKQLVLGAINIIRHIGKAFLYFLAIVFFIAATGSLAGKVSFDRENGFNGLNFFHFFENNSDKLLAHTAAFLGFLAIGFICLLLAKGLSRNHYNGRTNFVLRTTTLLISIFAIFFIALAGVKTASYFATYDKIENVISLDSTYHHFYLKSSDDHYHNHFPFFLKSDTLHINDVEVEIEETEGPSEILSISKAYGQNQEIARSNASCIVSMLSVKDSIITIPNSFNLSTSQVYRKQELNYKIKLHKGSKVSVDNDFWRGLHIRQRYDYHRASSGRTYEVTEAGVQCLDCTGSYKSTNANTSDYPLNIQMEGKEFNKVEVSSDINVKIIHGDFYQIKAKGTNDRHDLDIDFENNKVVISDNRKWGFNLVGEHRTIEVIIVTPHLTQLEISGVVQAELEGFNEDEISFDLSGTSTCIANVKAENIKLEQTGATKFTLDGNIRNFEASVSGASKLYAASTSINTVEINASGASYAEVNATEKLDAEASGASKIRYKGNVHEFRSNNTGASSVERIKE